MAAVDSTEDPGRLTFVANAVLVGLLTWLAVRAYVIIFHRPLTILRKLRAQGVPGRPFVPLVGHLVELFQTESQRNRDPALAASTDGLHYFSKCEERYGKLFTFCLATTPIVICSDPDIIRQVYVTHNLVMPKQDLARRMLSIMRNGLVVSEGELWQRQRHLIDPAFTMKEIKRIYPIMAKSVMKAVGQLRERLRASPEEAVPTHTVLPAITVQALGDAMFGTNLHSLGEGELDRMLAAISEHFPKAWLSGLLKEIFPPAAIVPFPLNVRVWRTQRTILSFIEKVLKQRRKASVRAGTQDTKGDAQGDMSDPKVLDATLGNPEVQKSPTDLLQLLLDATDGGSIPTQTQQAQHDMADSKGGKKPGEDGKHSKAMSEQQLIDECVNLLAAGFDTTATTLTWTMQLLSEHPEWQERAREEALALVRDKRWGEDDEWWPSFEQMSELKIINCIILETLRLYPIVAILGRTVTQDARVSESLTLPKGCDVQIIVSLLHRNKEFWGADADAFRPDRFLNGVSKASSHPGAYMPFSTGPRVCIGQNFAMAEAKVLLWALLRGFKWRVADDYVHHPVFFVTTRPKFGMPLLMTPFV